MNTDITMSVVHGRKGKTKVSFSGVVSKVMLSALVLSVVTGAITPAAFAAEIHPTNSTVLEFEQSAADALQTLRNTIQTVNTLKGQGKLTDEVLISLAVCVKDLESTCGKDDSAEALEVLSLVENSIEGVRLKSVFDVQVAVSLARTTFENTVVATQKAAPSIVFPDVPADKWFYSPVMELVGMGAINGYPDGTFGPQNTISYAEYLTILMKTVKGSVPKAQAGEVWYAGSLRAAYESQVLKNGEITDFTQPISRAEAAKFSEKAIQNILGEQALDTTNTSGLVADYSAIKGTEYEYYILQQYARGVVAGDTTGAFHPTSSITRAEASKIILNTAKPSARRDMSKVETPVKVENELIITEGPYAGRMRTAPSTEYDLQALQSARFYKENGKLYVSIDLPTLPDGFKWDWYVGAYTSSGEYVFFTTEKDTSNTAGTHKIEIVSKYDDKALNDIAVTTLEISVITTERQSMVSHKLSTDAKGQVLEQSSTDSSNAKWISFDTSNIFKW